MKYAQEVLDYIYEQRQQGVGTTIIAKELKMTMDTVYHLYIYERDLRSGSLKIIQGSSEAPKNPPFTLADVRSGKADPRKQFARKSKVEDTLLDIIESDVDYVNNIDIVEEIKADVDDVDDSDETEGVVDFSSDLEPEDLVADADDLLPEAIVEDSKGEYIDPEALIDGDESEFFDDGVVFKVLDDTEVKVTEVAMDKDDSEVEIMVAECVQGQDELVEKSAVEYDTCDDLLDIPTGNYELTEDKFTALGLDYPKMPEVSLDALAGSNVPQRLRCLETIEKIIRMYLYEGMSLEDMAGELGTKPTSISAVLRAYSVPLRKLKTSMSAADCSHIKRLVLDGVDKRLVAYKLSCTVRTVNKILELTADAKVDDAPKKENTPALPCVGVEKTLELLRAELAEARERGNNVDDKLFNISSLCLEILAEVLQTLKDR